jgi:hypothetical protein
MYLAALLSEFGSASYYAGWRRLLCEIAAQHWMYCYREAGNASVLAVASEDWAIPVLSEPSKRHESN